MNQTIDELALHRSKLAQYQKDADELRAEGMDVTAAMFQKYADREREIIERLEREQDDTRIGTDSPSAGKIRSADAPNGIA